MRKTSAHFGPLLGAWLAVIVTFGAYGLNPYRRAGQRRTSVMVSAPRGFVESTLSPEFEECSRVLVQHLDALATKIIESTLSSDTSDLEDAPALHP